MTELGDAEVTELQVVALSGHRMPEAARLYIKRTEAQRIISRQAGGIFGAACATGWPTSRRPNATTIAPSSGRAGSGHAQGAPGITARTRKVSLASANGRPQLSCDELPVHCPYPPASRWAMELA